MTILRTGLLLALALFIAACSSAGPRRVSEPAASIQQLTVRADGRWDVALRLNNFSSVAMRFDSSATWTSGEPVSPSLVANSFIRRFLSSTVIDIGISCVKRVMAQAGMSSSKARGGSTRKADAGV